MTSTTTETLKNKGTGVQGLENAQPGDLVFFDTYKSNGHVGIYLGDGKFLGAQSSTGVAVADMNSGYWKEKFNGNIRRVASNGVGGNASSSSSSKSTGKVDKNGLSYTNTWKLDKEATNSKSYQTFKGHLSEALNSGKIPTDKETIIALTELIGRESTWNPQADNPSSTAYGYGQFLKSTRQAYETQYGMSYDNPVNQIIMTYLYAKDRYGSPVKALQFWDKNNWY